MKVLKHVLYWLYTGFVILIFKETFNSVAKFVFNVGYNKGDKVANSVIDSSNVELITSEGLAIGILVVGLIIFSIYYWTPIFFKKIK